MHRTLTLHFVQPGEPSQNLYSRADALLGAWNGYNRKRKRLKDELDTVSAFNGFVSKNQAP